MRTSPLLAILTVAACGGSQPDANDLAATAVAHTAEPTSASTAAAAPEPSPTGPASGVATAPPKTTTAADTGSGKSSQRWSVGSGSGKGLSVENEIGQKLSVASIAWTNFLRQAEGLPLKEPSGANVSFASVTADGASAKDVVCRLNAWDSPPTDPLTMGVAIVSFVLVDAVPSAAMLKHRAALLACNGGKSTRVSWVFEKSKVTQAEVVGGDAKASACVSNVLKKSVAANSGACHASLDP